MKKRNTFVNIITYIIIFTFMTEQAVYTQSVSGLQPFSDIRIAPNILNNLTIPSGLGRISEIYKGINGKTIIHITDTHADYNVQKNYAQILKQIINERRGTKEEGRVLLAIEGAKGAIDTSLFRAIPDKEIKQRISEYFLKKGYLTGAEYFSIFAEDSRRFLFWGVDDKELYLKNLGLTQVSQG